MAVLEASDVGVRYQIVLNWRAKLTRENLVRFRGAEKFFEGCPELRQAQAGQHVAAFFNYLVFVNPDVAAAG